MSSSPSRVAVVTGVTRGIGLAICEKLASGYFAGPLTLYAASRGGAMPPLKTTPLAPNIQVVPVQVNLTDARSADALAAKVRDEQGGCDVLINNAGVYHYDVHANKQKRREMYDVNYHGNVKMCRAFIPVMRDGGRIVNLSSFSGLLRHMAPHLQAQLTREHLTLAMVSEFLAGYERVRSQSLDEAVKAGWPAMAYFPSKAALNAATRILAAENPHLLINCCCPGWVNTDLGDQAGKPPKTPEQGAQIPLRLAFQDIGSTTGHYWANNSTAEVGDGKIQDF